MDIQDLPPQYDHAAAQQRWYEYWEKNGFFHAEPDDPGEPYCVVIPPPNVTGALHLGHALNNTLQDILCRQKRMQGRNVLWMPGTDHAGIATQAVVERRLHEEENKTRHDLGRAGLVERIWQWKEQYEKRILGQLKQLGCSCDWERTRFTLDDQCAQAVRETFFRLFCDGKIYRGKRLVNWDTFLQTAVSDDEVFHDPVKGHFWHFKYPVVDPQPGEPTHVTIATTRPETMLGDTAVAVHPDPERALRKVVDELEAKLAQAPEKEKAALQASLESARERLSSKLPELVALREMAARGVQLELPLTGRRIPLIADIWAKPELGSGCVKITPAHDENDYQVWQRNESIGAINILNPDGTLNDNVPAKYRGLSMKKARAAAVADLEEAGLHDPETDVEDREIDLAHSDRSKTPIEPYLADQWFVEMDELAQSAMDAVSDGRVTIVPNRYSKGYLDWLGEKRDWPIGRQLWWGHQIPVWTVEVANHEVLHKLNEATADACADADWAFSCDQESSDSEFTAYLCLVSDDEGIVQRIESLGYVRESDVLDTWFSSALWPHSTLGWPEATPELKTFYPTSTLVTSRDIITLWVARMVLTGLYNMGEIPFHEVYIHPKILDGYGETMSKSKGNGVDPLDVIEKFGADALRFGIAYLTTETQDVRMPVEFVCPHCDATIKQTKKNRVLPRIECSECGKAFRTQWASSDEDLALPRGAVTSERFELGRNFCNKLWNAARFVLMNLEGYEPAPIADEQLLMEDRWLLSRLATVTEQVTAALESYRFAEAARTLYDFAWDEFCSFYVEMTKARLDVPEQRGVAQQMLAYGLDALLRLLHPITPFLSEEVWQLLAQQAPQRGLTTPSAAAKAACVAEWPTADSERRDAQIEAQFADFQAVLGVVREIRTRQNVPSKAAVEFAVRCDPERANRLKAMQPYFTQMARAEGTAWGAEATAPETAASQTLTGDQAGIEVHVDIADFIDVEAEKSRLTGERTKLLKFVGSLEGKLANENFVSRAPAEVVEQQREKLVEVKGQLEAIEKALAKF